MIAKFKEMKMQIEQEIAAAGKGTAGAATMLTTYAITMNDMIGALTVIYLVAQIGYLFWKWRRELRKS